MRRFLSITPTLLTFQYELIDNPKRTTNIFNNFFSTISKKTRAKIKYSYEKYTIYPTNNNPNLFLFSSTEKAEIKLIISSLDISDATGPLSIPTKVLKMILLTNLLIYLIFHLQQAAFKLY